ncbi:hypothetical protein HZA57_06640 [Candidatus Poribacteria bacterium]|nr:hypothetical protein [Candidatus Poribacteria bacterium]
MKTHKIGLLLGDEEDWPSAFELLLKRLRPKYRHGGEEHEIICERIRIHPFDLRAPTAYHLVIDRLAYWHFTPREWLKKAALLNNVYLLNNPFTFQSMEKHSAYCAMIRLGLPIPATWLIPEKKGRGGKKYEVTAAKYHDMFDLPAIARGMGYPLYMKPFDGGGWRGVSRIDDEAALRAAYDSSGESLMHLQKAIDKFDVFVRSLAIGPQVMTMNYDPSQPQHGRYQISHGFLDEAKGNEARITVKLINAFFRWEFNSCESILKDGVLAPIDFANACPDIAITSLHFYFPWAIKSLYAWSAFCAATGRGMRINLDVDNYFEIGDSDRTYEEKLEAYEELADAYFQTKAFEDFRATQLSNLDEAMWEMVQSPEFDNIITGTVRSLFPAPEHDQFISHYRGLLKHWVDCEGAGKGKAT